MPLNYHQKALRLAKSMRRKTKPEKREIAHALCQYCVAVLAKGHQSTKIK